MKQQLLAPESQSKGYLLIGYPRNVETLLTFLAYEQPTHAILLKVDSETALNRSLARGRKDDTPELIQKRVKRFTNEELPVWETLKNNPELQALEVDANQTVERVTQELLRMLV